MDPHGPDIQFNVAELDLGVNRVATLELRNAGDAPAGPVTITAAAARNAAGLAVTGAQVLTDPSEIPTLNPGAARTVHVTIDIVDQIPDDDYSSLLEASTPEEGTVSAVTLDFLVNDEALSTTVATVSAQGATDLRQGEVAGFTASASDAAGAVIADAAIAWTVDPATAGLFDVTGRFVPYEPGAARIIATAGQVRDTLDVTIAPRDLTGTFSTVGQGVVSTRHTSDVWIHGTLGLTGTWSVRNVPGVTDSLRTGNIAYAWDLTNPALPRRVDSIRVDARVVNDVKISADGRLAVMTHEGSNDLQNGVTLLDLSNPFQPTPITRFTNLHDGNSNEPLNTGVHNAWIDGDYLYLVVDGVSPTSGLRIVDIGDPANPQVVATYYAGSSFLHDVYVRDGLAFLSHWNAGLVILDVGNGILGGSPQAPVEVGGITTQGGQTHNAWYWPAGGYVFVGEEDFGTPGILHVVDVTDLEGPREVATFSVPGSTPHNLWLDETRGILYVAWYANGIRALDVSGELFGQLERQGREIAGVRYGGGAGAGCSRGAATTTCNWAPQLHDGLLYLSDMNTGLWVLDLTF